MTGAIRIEIYPLGLVRVAIAQPPNPEAADRLWNRYRAPRPQFDALEQAARREGSRQGSAETGGAR